ncbi:MAG: DUF1365 domain-containing protein [Alphaproteobacteria bacterium]
MSEAARRSRLYRGVVMHRRLAPFPHAFRYRIFALVVDLDELPALARALRLFAYNRAGLFSFHDRDHGPRDGSPLRPWVEGHLRAAGIAADGGRIELLSLPRVLGYVFNPLSIYFCHDRDGRLAAILYEVKNTVGDQHGYLIPARTDATGWVSQSQEKKLHVSPFLPMASLYRFRVRPPGDRVAVVIRQSIGDVPALVATLAGERRPLSDRSLLGVLLALPFATLRVIVQIHWQALRLWRKGAAFHRRPDPPAASVTYHGRT